MSERISQKSSRAFIVGATIVVVFSLVIGYLHVGVLYLLGIPILGLLSGIVLVWVSKASLNKKILTSLLIIPLVIGMFLFRFFT